MSPIEKYLNRVLTTLSVMMHNLNNSLDYKDVAYQCLFTLSQNLELTQLAIWTPQHNHRKQLEIKVGIGVEKQKKNKLSLIDDSQNLVCQVFNSGVFNIMPIRSLPSPKSSSSSSQSFQTVYLIAVPIIVNCETVGVISSYTTAKITQLDPLLQIMKIVTSILSQTLKLSKVVMNKEQVLLQKNNALKAELENKYQLSSIRTKSPIMAKVISKALRMAQTESIVFIHGEPGTGRALLAKSIHYSSPRKKEPFVIFNCGTVSKYKMEQEIFGYHHQNNNTISKVVKSQLQRAQGGTLFLSSIEELPLGLQSKLLTVINDGYVENPSNEVFKVNVRIICSSSQDLEMEFEAGNLQREFYEQLSLNSLFVPLLKHRKEDLLFLIEDLLTLFNKKYSKSVSLSKKSLEVFSHYDWPGNILELENTIERIVVLNSSSKVLQPDLIFSKNFNELSRNSHDVGDISQYYDLYRDKYERIPISKEKLRHALKETLGNQTLTAKLLGCSLRQVRYASKKYQINIKQYKE